MSMAADSFIQARVTPEKKALVRELAERGQVTDLALVKQLPELMLRTSTLAHFPTIEARRAVSRGRG
jgi:hypothetical protein